MMEPTTLVRFVHKRVDEVKRVRGALEKGESSLTEDEKHLVLE
jgi:hypothetical protein